MVFTIRFKILVFFKDEEALDQYIKMYYGIAVEQFLKVQSKNERLYDNGHTELRCINRSVSENARGYKAHIIAVQEDLTWGENWHDIRKHVLQPCLMSPIPVQVFDGV